MLIRVRRGLEANRLSYTPQIGEPTFTTDTKKLYIGDGVIPGGILVDLSGGGIVQTIVAGTNVTVDNTDPANPVVSATGGGGGAVDSVNGQTGEVELDADDISDSGTTHKFATAAEKTKLGHIAVTQAVDLDAMETKLAGIESNADVTDAENVGSSIHGASAKTTPVDADTVALIDSAASNVLKKLSWANIKATLKTYFDTFYQPVASVLSNTTASFTTALETKLNGIETNADVTDTANVTAAGALMDSEVTNLDDVKAFDPADYATADQGLMAELAVQPGDLADVAFSGDYADLIGAPSIPTSVDNLSPDQTGNNGKFLKTNGSTATWESIPGGGDMLASTYDPTNVAGDAFDQDNMADGTTNKNFTATEKTKLAGIETAADVTDAANVAAAGATMDADTSLAGNAYFLDEDNMASDSATKVPSQQSVKAYIDAAITAAKSAMLPVGSIVHLNVSTNPNTLYGFGTWARIEGRFIVGVSDSDGDFDLNDTGGAKTVTLTAAQSGLPAHNHTQNSHNHTQDAHSHSLSFSFTQNDGASNTDPGAIDVGANSNRYSAAPQGSGVANTTATNQATTATNNANSAADASSAHENLPPYIAKYIWQRTA